MTDTTILPSFGWAVIDHGMIRVDTVSSTQRHAMVSWLVRDGRILVLATMTDADVVAAFLKVRGTADVAEVVITTVGK